MTFTMRRRLRTKFWAPFNRRQRIKFLERGHIGVSDPLVGEPRDEYVTDAREW